MAAPYPRTRGRCDIRGANVVDKDKRVKVKITVKTVFEARKKDEITEMIKVSKRTKS